MNSKYVIEAVPGNAIGVQQSLEKKLTERLQHLLSCDVNLQGIRKIQVKITGDGTYVSHSMHILVIAFTIVNVKGEEFPNSTRGNHVLALINTTEDYKHLEVAVSELSVEVQKTNAIKINDTTFEIEHCLGGDWKFLAICLGIKAANACYSCIWCKCPSTDRYDLNKQWSISDVSKDAKTIEEIQNLSKLAKKRNVETFGCIRPPLFSSIAIDHVIPDILHLFLRICDVLINLLLVELQRQDDFNKRESRSKETRSNSVPLLTVYENVLKECKICFHFYQDKASKQPKWRDLTGPEKLRHFAKITISVLLPTIPNSADVQKLWADFLQLYKSLTSTTPVNHTEFQKDAAKWHRLFISVYQSKNVTPYIHLLSSHILEFLEKYKTIAPFS